VRFALKPISPQSVPRAIEKAQRYRLLNEPFQAESIALDVLAVDPGSQAALAIYVLALSDQFAHGPAGAVQRAREAAARLEGAYERLYYAGIVAERWGQVWLGAAAPGAREAAWSFLQEAMALYERAEAVRPPGNDDALLRWNTCARLIEAWRLEAPVGERAEYGLE
jgi:hypothetical protein